MAKPIERCPMKAPRRWSYKYTSQKTQLAVPGGQCGLPAGHSGPHTLLVPTGVPWFKLYGVGHE